MEAFGVHFRIDRQELYGPLTDAFHALRRAKDAEEFGVPDDWRIRLHPDVAARLFTLTAEQRAEDHQTRTTNVILVTPPQDAVGSSWDFGAILDSLEMGDYHLLEIVARGDGTAELQIDPHGYPYGGLGAFIAFLEAHGMCVLGVNESGQYEVIYRTTHVAQTQGTIRRKKWWQFWR